MSLFSYQNNKYLYLSIGFVFFAYVFLRAITVAPTHDELCTMEWFVHTWVYGAEPIVANNHFLNTFLIKLFIFFFGDSFFVIRLPNVLVFLVYLFFSYRISTKNFSKWLGLACFIALVCNPFLLDYFSLARGYGLSFACMMASLYYGIENIKSYSNATLSKSLAWATLSVFAIFSMIYFWAALALALNMAVVFRRDKVLLKQILIRSVAWGVILLMLVSYPIFMLVKNEALFYGDPNSFLSGTLLSVARYSLYSVYNYRPSVYIALGSFCFLLVFVAILSLFYNKTLLSGKNFILAVSIFIIGEIFILHHVAGVLYPLDRTALYLYPLSILCLYCCIENVNKYIRISTMTTVLVALLLNFFVNANFYRVALSAADSRTNEILYKINEIGKKANKVMNIDHLYSHRRSMLYHLERENYPFVRLIGRPDDEKHSPFLLPETDYYICGVWYDGCFDPKELANYDKDVFLDYTEDNIVVYTNLRPKKSHD